MDKVRVVLCGVGAVGRRIAKFLLEKGGVEIVGARAITPLPEESFQKCSYYQKDVHIDLN